MLRPAQRAVPVYARTIGSPAVGKTLGKIDGGGTGTVSSGTVMVSALTVTS